MTDTPRTPREIEREIEEQRSDLTSTLEDLQNKFSIDTIVRQISDQFREHGGDMGRSITEQVKANPIPLALTGIGLAWLMMGNAQKSASASHPSKEDQATLNPTSLHQGRSQTPTPAYGSTSGREPSWSREVVHGNMDRPSATDRMSQRVTEAGDQVSRGAAAVNDGLSSTATSLSDTASTAGSKAADAASSARSKLDAGIDAAKSSVSSAGSRIAEGTESLTEEGRQRVIAARQKALEMRRQTTRAVNQSADAASDFYDRQPLVIGALALAVGAALGGALPRTNAEDDFMGDKSDDLFDEAERIFEEEKSKVISVAQSVKEEVKDIAAETKADLDSGAPAGKTAGQAVGDKARSAVDRVADAAKTKAKNEKLGKPKI